MHMAVPSPCTGGDAKMVMSLQDRDSVKVTPWQRVGAAWILVVLSLRAVRVSKEIWPLLFFLETLPWWLNSLTGGSGGMLVDHGAAHEWFHTQHFPLILFRCPSLPCCSHQGALCGTRDTNNTRGFFPWGYFWQVLLLWQQINSNWMSAKGRLFSYLFLLFFFFFTTKKNKAVGVDLWQFYWNI